MAKKKSGKSVKQNFLTSADCDKRIVALAEALQGAKSKPQKTDVFLRLIDDYLPLLEAQVFAKGDPKSKNNAINSQ